MPGLFFVFCFGGHAAPDMPFLLIQIQKTECSVQSLILITEDVVPVLVLRDYSAPVQLDGCHLMISKLVTEILFTALRLNDRTG